MTQTRLEAWHAAGRAHTHRGHALFYREEGAGDALLLIHGFPTASWDWRPLWATLAARFRVIAPDMIGFGFSAKPQKYDYSILDQADLCENLLESCGVRRVHILAHDYGDTVAQEILARFNERQGSGVSGLDLRTVCFLNGGLFPETHRPRLIQKLLISPLGPLLVRMMSERGFRRSFSEIFGSETRPSAEELNEFWQLLTYNDGLKVLPLLIRYMVERRQYRPRWVGALQNSSVPLRVINGPEDPVSGLHMVERYRELVPNPDTVLLDGIGHYPQVEQPQGVLDAYLPFVTKFCD